MIMQCIDDRSNGTMISMPRLARTTGELGIVGTVQILRRREKFLIDARRRPSR